ncbi:3-phosphoglycerate kinase [Pseudomonas sp. gcc21]|uniref:3-phosphoglycerate kinase n=1 Tax=Pseudomonas sp. gcc21 TaxID=2726989 RepID=UPI0014515DB7|nr:3-phosphoglycerate kinase [Pseudomonas sp. gcc21]QJD58151.1 3-phosphoglycerate kinase [Pseudomonas sp. gcc21]
MRKSSAGLLTGLLFPLAAWAFPVDVEIQSKGVSVIASSSYLSNIATVTLANEGAERALCRATFVNGPERPPESRIRLDPGEHTVVTQVFSRHINRVRVAISCEPDVPAGT